MRLVAKVETRDALKEIDGIIAESDVIMVARGDLGLQMDIEDVPGAQKKIIHKCSLAGRPVITATQMLESMVKAARPTRAEASDVANAILDGTDAVMLSGETAAGDYPVESVKMMDRIAVKTEKMLGLDQRIVDQNPSKERDKSTEAVARAAVQLSDALRVKAILTTSTSGRTPRLVSKFRPEAPILCACWTPETAKFMAVVWGVVGVPVELPDSSDEAIHHAVEAFQRLGSLKPGDEIIVTAGVPAGSPGSTNMILVETV